MNILERTDLLIAAEDIKGILALDDNAFVGIGLYGVYDKRYTANLAQLNEVPSLIYFSVCIWKMRGNQISS